MNLPELNKRFDRVRTPNITEVINVIENIIDNVNFNISEINNINNILAERWDDLRFPATQLKVNPATDLPNFDYTNVGYLYDPASVETLLLIAQMPHAWKEGTNIRPHVHWTPRSTNTGSVMWELLYKWVNVGEVEGGSWLRKTAITPASGVTGEHQITSFGELNGSGKKISSILTMKLSRLGDDASDTYTADALLKEFDIHYLIDANGSLQEFIK